MDEEKTRVTTNIGKEYDYIIVGGGAAGCVLANRLTENIDVTVLLLEAGGDDAGIEDTYMAGKSGFAFLPEQAYTYKTTPQKQSCKGLKGNCQFLFSGKCLGGGTAINCLSWTRGVPGDYDLWAQMGCEDWDYRHVLPYFLKSENMSTKRLANNGYHAVGGLVTITEAEWTTPIAKAFVEAAQELGYKKVDCNSADPFGVMVNQMNSKDGVRESTSRAYLRPAMKRSNLAIAVNTTCTKILLDGKSVIGVKANRDGREITIKATREVILSAGAIESAKLLMLSGLGPRDHLDALCISVIEDLPVGKLLSIHPATMWPSYVVDDPVSLDAGARASSKAKTMWDANKTGPLSVTPLEAVLLVPNLDNPKLGDFLLEVITDPFIIRSPGVTGFNLKDEICSAVYDLPVTTHGFTLFAIISHPRSTGTLRLRSADPADEPIIDPNAFADQHDVQSGVRAMKLALAMRNTKPFKALGTRLIEKGMLPGFEAGDEQSDEYLEAMVKTMTPTGYHYIGTCRMGAADDPRAVVDPQLRVRGIKNLRVIDSGVMPEQPSANITAPTIMIAEKGADIILGRSLPPANLETAMATLKKWKND